MSKQKTRGFTLIELLVVIAIISLLSAVVLASLNSARQKANDARRYSDMHTLQVALELYYDKHGAYPTLTAGGSGCWGTWASGNSNGGSPTFMQPVIADGFLSSAPVETTLSGCTYRYVRTNGPVSCGSPTGKYGVLYFKTQQVRPANSKYEQPSCWSATNWGEAKSTDPNGNLIILPE